MSTVLPCFSVEGAGFGVRGCGFPVSDAYSFSSAGFPTLWCFGV